MANNTSLHTKVSPIAGELYLKLPIGFTIFEIGLPITIGLLGVVGNVIVCATIIRRPQVLSAMNQYLLSLAFADLGVLLFILPVGVLRIQFPFEWVLGKALCLYITPCSEMFYCASIWSITTIAVERYANIAWKKIRIGGRRSLKRSRVIIITIWVISFATTSLPVYIYRAYDSKSRRCYPTFSITFYRGFVTLNAMLQYVLPLSIIAFCYQRIGKRVSERSRLFQEETANHAQAVREPSSMVNARAILQQTKRTQRILKPLVILFALTMLPLNMFNLAAAYWDKLFYQNYLNLLLLAIFISTFTNSAADPLVYCIVSKEFRTEAKSMLPRCFRRHLGGQKQRDSTFGKGKRSAGTNESLIGDQYETKL
ncbi:hypothetical protein ACROYT_G003531 [Oculina patagonica]